MPEEAVSSKKPVKSRTVAKDKGGVWFHVKDYLHHISLFSKESRLFLIGTFFAAFTFAVFQLLLNLYLKEMGFKEGFIGSLLSATALGTLVISGPLIFLLPRFSYRTILIVSLAFSAIGYAFLSTAQHEASLWLAAFFSGASAAGLRLSAPPFFMQSSSPKERSYLFSLNFGTWILAAIMGSLLGGYLVKILDSFDISHVQSLRWSLLISIGFGLIGVIPFGLIKTKAAKKEGSSEIWKWQNFKKRGKIYFKLAFPLFLVGVGAGLIIPFLNLYFKTLFHQSAHQIGIYFAWLQIFMLAGIIIGPVVAKKWGMIRTIVFTELASIPFMLILAFTTKLSFAIGAFFIRGALMNMAQPISTHFAMEAVEEKEHPLVNSLIALAWTLSWVFSAGLGGKLIELYSFAPPLVVAAGLYVASAALYYYYFAKEEKKIFKPEPATLQDTG
ncbi:hypothetical protein A2W24_00540 [Microgenomates group bacterium RBG_16_45_19]|nr:MAG: hypothetical protein A2W24_00540 [Microgenomates group bacterium RBG_16_45_19]